MKLELRENSLARDTDPKKRKKKLSRVGCRLKKKKNLLSVFICIVPFHLHYCQLWKLIVLLFILKCENSSTEIF